MRIKNVVLRTILTMRLIRACRGTGPLAAALLLPCLAGALEPAPPVATVHGLVTNQAGGPLDGVTVQVFGIEELRDGVWARSHTTGRLPKFATGNDGRFAIAFQRTDVRYDIWFDTPGFAPSFLFGISAESRDITVEMKAGTLLSGTVGRRVNGQREPVPAATVELRISTWGMGYRQRAVTDADGRYTLHVALLPGRDTCVVAFAEQTVQVQLQEGKPVPHVDFEIDGPTVTGRRRAVPSDTEPAAEPELVWQTQSEPIDSGYFLWQDRFVPRPYIVARDGLDIKINGIVVSKGEKWSMYYLAEKDPGPPPHGASPLVDTDYYSRQWRFLEQNYDIETARRKMLELYRDSPAVTDLRWKVRRGRTLDDTVTVTYKTGQQIDVRFGGGREVVTKEQVVKRTEEKKLRFERRLKNGSLTWMGIGVRHGRGGDSMRKLLALLTADMDKEEKVKLLQEKGFVPRGNRRMAERFAALRVSPELLAAIATDAKRAAYEERLRKLKREGKLTAFARDWNKEPGYYAKLDTIALAKELFFGRPPGAGMGAVSTHVMVCPDDPGRAFKTLEVGDHGFSELFQREDMWKGILTVQHELVARIVAARTPAARDTVIHCGMGLSDIYALREYPACQEQIKDREPVFLAAALEVLVGIRTFIDEGGPDRIGCRLPFFNSPCEIGRMALALVKTIDPAAYDRIAPPILTIRFPKEQKMQDVRDFIHRVIVGIDPLVTKQAKADFEEVLAEGRR